MNLFEKMGIGDWRGPVVQIAVLQGATLEGADLGDANLRGADLGDATLEGADLGDANLRGADLRDATLEGADLGDADLRGADLRRADLRGANLRRANLRDANLEGADLDLACWPLWCGSMGVKVDIRLVRQLLAHVACLDCDDPAFKEIHRAIIGEALKSHRAEDLGLRREP